jgi:hypothetical protein
MPEKVKKKATPVDNQRVIMTENKSMASKPIEIPKSTTNSTISQNSLDFLTSSRSDDNAKKVKPSKTKNPRKGKI